MQLKASLLLLILFPVIQIACSDQNSEWSPDNADLVFMSNRFGNAEIYLKTGSDSSWVNLTNDPSGDNWPVWSPDGNKIVFQSNRSGNLDIWLMNADGSKPIQLTTDEDFDYLPAFSPDGKKLTFTSWRMENTDSVRSPHIYIMNTDGSDQYRLLAEDLNTSSGASWHPTENRFLYSKRTGSKGADIYEADMEGNTIRQLTSDTLYNGSAVYSPDGSMIAFHRDYGERSSLVLMNYESGVEYVLLEDGMNYYPSWSPDGKWIVYSSIVEGTEQKDIDIFMISADPTIPDRQEVLIRSPFRDVEASWKPASEP